MPTLEPTQPPALNNENSTTNLPTKGIIPTKGPHTHCFSVMSMFYLQTDWTETVAYVVEQFRKLTVEMGWGMSLPDDYHGKYIWGENVCRNAMVIEHTDPNDDKIVDNIATITISKADLQKALTDGKTEIKFDRVKINLHPIFTVKIKITP